MKVLKKILWKFLEPKVSALVTRRIITFHAALVERGQLSAPLVHPDPKETCSLNDSSRCTEDCAV
jgi:hypothetical protein